MVIRRFLIISPLILIILLLQSYFWVPTYEEQTKNNPKRLTEYISGSIGDASLLNPILSSDSASSTIGSKVFEGLIDRDEDLRLRGRLAKSWKIFEEVLFYVNEEAIIPGVGMLEPQELVDYINRQRMSGSLPKDLKNKLDAIVKVSLIPPKSHRVTKTIEDDKKALVELDVTEPHRIRLTLNRVDQTFLSTLQELLGKTYFESFPALHYLGTKSTIDKKNMERIADEILPVTEENPILVFNLRPDIKFHDGHILDADDVKFTYESIMNPKNLSPRIADYEPVKKVEVIDPLTIRIVYKRLYSPAIGTWSMGILPEHLLNEKMLQKEAESLGKNQDAFSIRQSRFNRHPVGCGPFKFRTWKSDQYIILDRFMHYWEGPPNYEIFTYRVIPNLLTQEMEFYGGTLDSYDVRPHQVARLKKNARFQNFSGLSFGYTYIGYNLRREPFDDVRVRKALGMAIDVDKIIKYTIYSQGDRITGPFVKQTDYYNHNIDPLPYDPENALELLNQAGWEKNASGQLEKNGKKLQFTLITNNGNEIRRAILAIAQDSWKQIGIDVKTDLLEWSVFLQERVHKLDFDALILGWQMGIDPDLFQIWHSSQTNSFQLNFVGFKNKTADDLILKIRREYDHDRQVAFCHELHKIIAQEQPYTFLYVGKWTAILDKRIVIKEKDEMGKAIYNKIKPSNTGIFNFDFNKWTKLKSAPVFSPED